MYDCRRNAKSGFARHYLSAKQVHKLHAEEQVQKVKLDHGVDYYEAVPLWAQHGSLTKKEQYEYAGVNLQTNAEETTVRTRCVARDVAIDHFSPEALEMTVAKYWVQGDQAIQCDEADSSRQQCLS